MLKYTCPYCGNKTFNPLQKALCGGMTSKGKQCPDCGGWCVNGKPALIAGLVLSLIGLCALIYAYFTFVTTRDVIIRGVIPFAATLVLRFVFNMFFGKLIPQYCNVPVSKILGGVLAILLLVCAIVKIVLCIMEIKSRPADFYLPTLGG